MESVRAIKLRYIDLDPEIIAELPNWSKTELERESERTLKELSITRRANESYLLAWARAMLEENDCENNADNHKRLIVAIREDWKAQLFVWALGGDERKAFGLEDSPAFQEHLVRFHAARYLAPGAFYDHDDPRYWGEVAQSVLGLLLVAYGMWTGPDLWSLEQFWPVDLLLLLLWMLLIAAGIGSLVGLSNAIERERGGEALRHLTLWVAVPTALTVIGLHVDASRKLEADSAKRERLAVQPKVDEESVEEVGYIMQMRRADHLGEHRRNIYWFVKVPATNKVYYCSWESGFSGFAKDDAIKVIHKKSDIETDDYGFIVGLRRDAAGRSALVWVMDTDWWACRTRTCDYYTHYLAYGPPELTHEGFHAACQKCVSRNRADYRGVSTGVEKEHGVLSVRRGIEQNHAVDGVEGNAESAVLLLRGRDASEEKQRERRQHQPDTRENCLRQAPAVPELERFGT